MQLRYNMLYVHQYKHSGRQKDVFDQTFSSMYYYLLHTAEPLVPEPSAFKVELAIEKLKSHKSPGIEQIPA